VIREDRKRRPGFQLAAGAGGEVVAHFQPGGLRGPDRSVRQNDQVLASGRLVRRSDEHVFGCGLNDADAHDPGHFRQGNVPVDGGIDVAGGPGQVRIGNQVQDRGGRRVVGTCDHDVAAGHQARAADRVAVAELERRPDGLGVGRVSKRPRIQRAVR
jgi:hypothetical protein